MTKSTTENKESSQSEISNQTKVVNQVDRRGETVRSRST